ncbi:metal ABC transporter substrate-binding protein [Streptomonospora litoralis]|uniref:High-affinity zinc uptake system binding-protein ZnuA n=1 Tax=Streptomonospora litoralis TaxID=2498135 RepID=A0A4P6PXY6_9ACTN|nr:zinc ABC transporter substrate-binding protein [Streptomonospora litoralis]QBI53136.1 High-affinity zinc uptake system binding-protein ZnuA precursor [Streptomonospora litoralis]
MRGRIDIKLTAVCAAAVLTAAGCGDGGQAAGEASGKLSVVTGVYPLQWLAEQVGGDHVDVANLTEPGAGPHDLELTPRQIGQVGEADVAFYVAGLQPAVDDAVESQGGGNALDVAELVDLRTLEANAEAAEGGHDHGAQEGGDHEHGGEASTDDAQEGGDHDHDHGEEGAHGHGALDPHMWLDTERFAEAASGLADRLAELDPDHSADYAANAESVDGLLGEIGTEYTEGLAECESRDIVVSHSAFGYLAARFDLHQISPAGLDPHSEPSPARLAEVAATVREHDITTVFTEPLSDSGAARTIAAEADAETAILDPIEGITDRSPGDDYPSIMRANLDTLTEALRCS